MSRRLVLSCLVSFALGVALTLGALAVYPDQKAASSAAQIKRNDSNRSISWTKAQRKLGRCKVEAVEEARNRLITLTLRTGTKVSTYEPSFGDVVHELARVRHKCGEIKLSAP
jgi:hypothetical protein